MPQVCHACVLEPVKKSAEQKFTLDTYGHITPAMKQDTANKICGFLSGTA